MAEMEVELCPPFQNINNLTFSLRFWKTANTV